MHAGSGTSSGLTLSNVGPNSSGYTETLFTTGFNANNSFSGNGAVSGLAQGSTSNGLSVAYNAGSVGGVYTGTATLGLASSAINGSGLGTTGLASQQVNLTADVYNLASGALSSNSLTLYMHAGSGTSSGLSLSNVGPNSSGYTETLFTTGFNANNSFSGNGAVSGLAQGSTSNGLSVGYNAGSVGGVYTGTATLGLASSAINGSGLGTTGLASQQVNLIADVYNLASGALSSNSLTLIMHAGSATSSGLTLSNVGPNTSGYTESLFTTSFTANSGFSANGAVTGLAQGASNSGGLTVGYNASGQLGGVYNGTATLGLASSAINNSGLGTTGLSSQTVNVTAEVYNLASGIVTSNTTINLGNLHLGATALSGVTVMNSGILGNYTEALDAFVSNLNGSYAVSGGAAGDLVGRGQLVEQHQRRYGEY